LDFPVAILGLELGIIEKAIGFEGSVRHAKPTFSLPVFKKPDFLSANGKDRFIPECFTLPPSLFEWKLPSAPTDSIRRSGTPHNLPMRWTLALFFSAYVDYLP
jgi:hypothetical protein